MPYVIAQVSDIHIGGANEGSGARFSAAIDEINAMTREPDLVLLTGDLTEHGSPAEWAELKERIDVLSAPWEAILGNHDRGIRELAGHRSMYAGSLRLVLVDSSSDTFTGDDEDWLNAELSAHPDTPTIVAIHHPPFETGIWWMDCVGLQGSHLFERVIRRHSQVIKVLSGHAHRLIQTSWAGCSLWVCPATAYSVVCDLDPTHDPAQTAEAPSFSLHAYTGEGIVSHVVPVGPPAKRSLLREKRPAFVTWAESVQQTRESLFKPV
jgi:Icc protein